MYLTLDLKCIFSFFTRTTEKHAMKNFLDKTDETLTDQENLKPPSSQKRKMIFGIVLGFFLASGLVIVVYLILPMGKYILGVRS